MITGRQRDWQCADRTKVLLHPLLPLTVQLLVLQLCRALLAGLLVLLAVGLLTVNTAVLDEAAGRAALELDGVATELAAVGAAFDPTILNRNALHYEIEVDDYLRSRGLLWRVGEWE